MAVIGDIEAFAHDRSTRWDDDGSLLLWPFGFAGQPKGQVIPLGAKRAAAVGAAASNVRARVTDDARAVIELDD